jgi:hypothetical protein
MSAFPGWATAGALWTPLDGARLIGNIPDGGMPFRRGHDRIVGTDETAGAQPGMTQMNVETRDGQRLYADRWLAMFVLCSLVFVALTVVVSSFGVAAAERALYQWIVERDTPGLDVLFNWIDELGNEVVLLVAARLLALALPSRRGQPWWLLIAVLLLSYGIEELVEQIVGRSGPGGTDAGFPSGGAAATAGVLSSLAPICCSGLWRRRSAKAAVWGGAVPASCSRKHQADHCSYAMAARHTRQVALGLARRGRLGLHGQGRPNWITAPSGRVTVCVAARAAQ